LFDGCETMLRALAADGLRLTLVSSDSKANGARQARRDRRAVLTTSLLGFDLRQARQVPHILSATAIDPARAIAIGDETRDIEAARATGTPAPP